MDFNSCESRMEVLRFMLACEQFLAFVQLNGGVSILNLEDRRRILAYQRLINVIMLGEKHSDDEQYSLPHNSRIQSSPYERL